MLYNIEQEDVINNNQEIKIDYTKNVLSDNEFINLIKNKLNDYNFLKQICRKYPINCMETLFIEPKLGARIKLNPAQKKVINLVLNSNDVFLLGSRQIAGKSTIALYLTVYLSVFYEHYYVYYISLEASRQCAEFIQNVERVIDSFPFIMQHKRTSLNNAQIVLENKSMIMTAAAARKSEFSSIAKSKTAHFIIIDEFSDIKKNSELLSTISATMAATRKLSTETNLPTSIALISNAFEIVNENHQYTYNLWMKSIAGKTNYKPILFYYRALMSEEEADKFIEQEIKRGVPMKQILVNYECYFTRSENTFIDDDNLLQRLYNARRSYTILPIIGTLNEYHLKIYDISKLNDVNIIAIDTATKYGSDYYAIVGITNTGELILEYNNKLSFDEAIELIKKIDELFPNAYIIIERNAGAYILEHLERTNIKLYYENNKPGFFTNEKKKRDMFVILKEFLYRNAEKLYSESILKELLTLKAYRNSFRSDTHDDLAMAYAIAIYINELEKLKNEEISDELKQEYINKIGLSILTDTNNMQYITNNKLQDQLLYEQTQTDLDYYNGFSTVDLFISNFSKKRSI